MFNKDSKFDFDLSKGIENEKSIASFLGISKSKFECIGKNLVTSA